MNVVDTSVTKIKEQFPDVYGIWLFGSSASQTTTAESDVDLGVLLPQRADSIKLWQCAQSIAAAVNKEIDLVDLLEASTVMRAQIMREGKRVFCADKFKSEMFETEALTDYLRFNEERKEVLGSIKYRGKVLGNNGRRTGK